MKVGYNFRQRMFYVRWQKVRSCVPDICWEAAFLFAFDA